MLTVIFDDKEHPEESAIIEFAEDNVNMISLFRYLNTMCKQVIESESEVVGYSFSALAHTPDKTAENSEFTGCMQGDRAACLAAVLQTLVDIIVDGGGDTKRMCVAISDRILHCVERELRERKKSPSGLIVPAKKLVKA